MIRRFVIGVALIAVMSGCAYNAQGQRVRSSQARFDAQSVSSPKTVYTLSSDGTWAGLQGDRYERVGDSIKKVGAFGSSPSLIRPSGWVSIDRLPDGVMYTASYYSAGTWIFVTEDGKPIPEELEVPLYLAAQLGIGGHKVNVWKPAQDDNGPELASDCELTLFEIQGRQVAGWFLQHGAVCPAANYPGKTTLTKMVRSRGEVWESTVRPAPWKN